jgi:hypothetical protein
LKKIDRILKYIESQGIRLSAFEREAKLGNSYFANTKKRGEDVTAKMLDRIRNNVPEDYYKIFPEEKEKGTHIEEHEPGYTKNGQSPSELEKLREELEQLKASLTDKEELIRAQQKIIELQERILNQGGNDEGGIAQSKRSG